RPARPTGAALPGRGGGLPPRARRRRLPRLTLAAGARAAPRGPDRLLRDPARGGRRPGRRAGRRPPPAGPRGRRLRRHARVPAATRRRRPPGARPGPGGPALRDPAGRIRHRPGRPARGTGAVPAGRVRALVPDQAAALAGPVPATRGRPAGPLGAAGRTDGASRRLAAAHERQRDAGAQRALAAGGGARAGTRCACREPGRTRRRPAPPLAAPPGLRRPRAGGFHLDRASIGPMVARNRLPPWHEEIRLRNGREVLIRPIRPEDAPALRAGFELLEPA